MTASVNTFVSSWSAHMHQYSNPYISLWQQPIFLKYLTMSTVVVLIYVLIILWFITHPQQFFFTFSNTPKNSCDNYDLTKNPIRYNASSNHTDFNTPFFYHLKKIPMLNMDNFTACSGLLFYGYGHGGMRSLQVLAAMAIFYRCRNMGLQHKQ